MKKRFTITLATLVGLLLLGLLWANSLSRTKFPPLNLPEEYRCMAVNSQGYLHLSVDDSNSIFSDLTTNQRKYKSVFDQPLLGFVKKLHDQYGICISFYVFYSWDVENGSFTLSDATDKYAQEFSENADWLRFGFHAIDAPAYELFDAERELEYYNTTIQELVRITGSEACIDSFIRLDRYIANQDAISQLKSAGLDGLFITERAYQANGSYALTPEQLDICYTEDWYVDDNNIAYTPTDMRLESFESDEEFYTQLTEMVSQPHMIVFTHEWILEDEDVQKYMSWLSQFAAESGIKWSFPEDHIKGV